METYTGQQLTGTEIVQYSDSSGTLQVGSYTVTPYQWYPYWERDIHHWYPLISYVTEKSKVEQGFKIVGKLLENKIIKKELTIKEFIKLVNDIANML